MVNQGKGNYTELLALASPNEPLPLMYLFRVLLQGYDREKGWGFTLSLNVCGKDPAEARAIALEEAIRQGMPVAIVWSVTGGNPAPADARPGVSSVSPRAYREEDDPKAESPHPPTPSPNSGRGGAGK